MATPGFVVPALLGAAGLYQSGQQANSQKNMQKRALKGAERDAADKKEIRDILKGLADQYDPGAQTKIAVDAASGVASQTLERALGKLKGKSGPAGPGDSEFHVSAQRSVNDAFDPLKLFAAEQVANEPIKKAEMYQRVLGAPTGNMADSYFKAAASMPRSDPAGSLALLSQAIQKMLNKGATGGAGGSGDFASGAIGGGLSGGATDYSFLGNLGVGSG